jgi:hypothetical protein
VCIETNANGAAPVLSGAFEKKLWRMKKRSDSNRRQPWGWRQPKLSNGRPVRPLFTDKTAALHVMPLAKGCSPIAGLSCKQGRAAEFQQLQLNREEKYYGN